LLGTMHTIICGLVALLIFLISLANNDAGVRLSTSLTLL
jgi:hypothetical protein